MLSSVAHAQVFQTQAQALHEVFLSANVLRQELFLTPEQKSMIEQRARSKLDSQLLVYYQAMRDGKNLGYAFFDTHVVRTQPETLLVVLDAESRVTSICTLAFNEPQDFLPPQRWLKLFQGRTLSDALWLKQDIVAVAGSTLSSWATLKAVRRALAVYDVMIRSKDSIP